MNSRVQRKEEARRPRLELGPAFFLLRLRDEIIIANSQLLVKIREYGAKRDWSAKRGEGVAGERRGRTRKKEGRKELSLDLS